MSYDPPTGSVVAFQSDPTKLVGTVSVVGTLPVVTNNNSVIAVLTNSSVAALQGTNPWIVNMPSPSVIAYQLAGSVLAVSGSFSSGNSSVQVVGIMPPQSVSGVGLFNVNHTGNGSVITVSQGSVAVAIISGSVAVTVTPVANQSVSGTVQAELLSTNASIITVGGTSGNSSVLAFQGTIPWVMQSIVGTYAEDATHTTGDRGLFTLGVRNDNISSLVSADLEYVGSSKDSSGRTIVKPFAPEEVRFSYTGSVVSTSVTLIAPSVTGKRNYITDFFVANTGATTTRVVFLDGSTSILAHTIAPTTGGSNAPGMAMPIRTNPSQDLTFQGVTATSVLYVTVNGYQAP